MKPWKRLLLPILFALALPGALLAQAANNPFIGTWVLNISKSTFKPANTAPRSQTRIFEAMPDGMLQATFHTVVPDGTASTATLKYKDDGKPYTLTGYPPVDTVKQTRVSPREVRGTFMLNGKVVGRFTDIVSEDGKSRTATMLIPNASGKADRNVWVFDRR